MTEKDYRSLVNEISLNDEEKEIVNSILGELQTLNNCSFTNDFVVTSVNKYGAIQTNTMVNSHKHFSLAVLIENNMLFSKQLTTNIIFNSLENALVNLKTFVVLNFERDYDDNLLFVKTNNYSFDIKLCFQEEDVSFLIDNFIDELNSKYTYFKNVYKIVKHYIYEQEFNLDENLLLITIAYGLENYFAGNKYEDYFKAIDKAIDDFLSKKKIELVIHYKTPFVHEVTNYKNYIVIDPFTANNLATKINEVNVQDYRKFKKTLAKLWEDIVIDTKGSAIVTVDVTPLYDEDKDIYMWSYVVSGRGISSSGGEYPNDSFSYKTAVLKGLFRGLKAVLEQIRNKNITVICPVGKVLECIKGRPEEQENNSRRKTITKLIDDNKLKIKWEIKK